MRKNILLILLIPFVCIQAQNWIDTNQSKFIPEHDFRIGVGNKPYEASHVGFWGSDWNEPPLLEPNIIDFNSTDYYTGARYTTNAIFGEYMFQANSWFGIGGTLTYFAYFNNFYNVQSDQKVGSNIKQHISIYPTLRFTWLNRTQFSMYSSFGIGRRFIIENDRRPNNSSESFTNSYGCQFTLLGATIGDKWYVFSDIVTIGTQGFFSVGLGYRIQRKIKR